MSYGYGNAARNMSHRADRSALFGGRGGRGGDLEGGGERDALVAEQTNQMFEDQNNRYISALSDKVSQLKGLSLGIGAEVREQNRFLDGMGGDFGRTDGLLGGTLKKLGVLARTGGGRHICHLALFVVAIFFFVWWLVGHKHT